MTRYCPAGDGPFEDWVERCPECGRRLVALPPAAGDQAAPTGRDEPVVYLATEPNEPLAQLAVQVLADEGIRVLVRPAGPGFGAWASVATFEHELYVLRRDVDRARAILAELDEADPADDRPDAAEASGGDRAG